MSCSSLKASFHDSASRSKRNRARQNKLEKWRNQCYDEEDSIPKYHERITAPLLEKCAPPSVENLVCVGENMLEKTPFTSMFTSQPNMCLHSIDRYCTFKEESSNLLNACFSLISKVNYFIHIIDDALLLQEVGTIEGKLMRRLSTDGENTHNHWNFSLSKMHRTIIQTINDLRTSQRIISMEKSKYTMTDNSREKNIGFDRKFNSETSEQQYQNGSDIVVRLANKNWMVDYLDVKEKEIQIILQKMRRQLFLVDKLNSVDDYHTMETNYLLDPTEESISSVNSSPKNNDIKINYNNSNYNINLSLENRCES